MARARQQFRKAQMGKELTWGTGVAATYVIPGLTTIRWQPTNAVVRAEKLNGSLAAADGADVVGKAAAAVLGGYVCPQFFPLILEGAYGAIVPTADAGTPIAYTRVAAPALSAEDVPVSRSLEAGSNISNDQWRLRGALPMNFEITGRIGDFARYTSNWLGRALEAHAFTGALTRPGYTRTKAKNTKVFIDDITDDIGTTQITADCVVEYAFRSGNLWALANCMDGQLEASGYAQETQDPELVLTIQLGALTKQLFDDYEAGAMKYVRLQIPGVNIHGTPTVDEMIQIDMAANITTFPEVGDTENEHGMVAAITFSGSEDNEGSFGKLIEYTVVSEDATLAA